jgi:hypothetical protein
MHRNSQAEKNNHQRVGNVPGVGMIFGEPDVTNVLPADIRFPKLRILPFENGGIEMIFQGISNSFAYTSKGRMKTVVRMMEMIMA